MSPNPLLAHAYTTARKLVHLMVDDLTEDEWLHQPVPGSNCAAWIVGHLTLITRGALLRNRVHGLPDFPADLKAKVTATSQIAGEQLGFGDTKELLALFDAHIEAYTSWVGSVTEEALAKEPGTKVPFSTTLAEAIQFGAMHIAMHTGQLTIIRRSLGKPPLF